MPLYEYQCEACAHRFEVIQKFSDPPVDTCPQCSGSVKKLLSSPAIQFKGSGWYITDYARKGANAKGSSGDKADQTSDQKTDQKTEQKTDKGTSGTSTESSSSTSSSGATTTPNPS
jgi:putative FmdB family regulatory protein